MVYSLASTTLRSARKLTKLFEGNAPTAINFALWFHILFFFAAPRTGCLPGWQSFTLKKIPFCYLEVRYERHSWVQAQEYCREKNANLTSIVSEEEFKFLRRLTKRNIWLGLKMQRSWRWSDRSVKLHYGRLPRLVSRVPCPVERTTWYPPTFKYGILSSVLLSIDIAIQQTDNVHTLDNTLNQWIIPSTLHRR